jgi:hypothetical protein
VAGELDPGGGRLQNTGSNEEVVGVTLGRDPSLAFVGADLQALGTAGGVLHSSCEPVLGSTTVHVNAERVGDGALNELPLDTVNSTCGDAAGEFGPGGRSHVEMVLVSTSLVGNLFGNKSVDVHSFGRTSINYHHNDLLSLVSNADATTAVRAGVPDVLRHTGRSIDGRGQSVVGESACTVLPAVLFLAVQPVASAHASVQITTEQVAVGRRVRAQETCAGLQSKGCESQSGGKY